MTLSAQYPPNYLLLAQLQSAASVLAPTTHFQPGVQLIYRSNVQGGSFNWLHQKGPGANAKLKHPHIWCIVVHNCWIWVQILEYAFNILKKLCFKLNPNQMPA